MLLHGKRFELDNGNDDDDNVSEGWTWPSQVSPLCSPKRSAHCTNTITPSCAQQTGVHTNTDTQIRKHTDRKQNTVTHTHTEILHTSKWQSHIAQHLIWQVEDQLISSIVASADICFPIFVVFHRRWLCSGAQSCENTRFQGCNECVHLEACFDQDDHDSDGDDHDEWWWWWW